MHEPGTVESPFTTLIRAVVDRLRDQTRGRIRGLVNKFGPEDVSGLGEQLLEAVDVRRGRSAVVDDQTLIVIKRNRTLPPRPSLLRTARTLAKLIGMSRV